MFRRRLAFALLAVLAVQFAGGLVFASACPEPCPDDTEETSCPPVCALCTSCTHAQQAIVQVATDGFAMAAGRDLFSAQTELTPSGLAADIFHVPLRG